MEDSRPIGTPMSTRHKLSKNDYFKEVDQTTYRSMIGKLWYVVHTRPNIALVIGMVARFSTNPKANHMMAIKINFTRILSYIPKPSTLQLSIISKENWYKIMS